MGAHLGPVRKVEIGGQDVTPYLALPEVATVTVKVSPELLAQLRKEWSPPVQIMVERVGSEWEMTFRQHRCDWQS